jgi:uncharacterized protein (TIGR03067 family)
MTLEVRGDTMTLTIPRQNQRSTATLKLEATKTPRRLTWTDIKTTDFDGKPTATPSEQKVVIGIYKLDGDRFVMAIEGDGKDSVPEDFAGKPGSATHAHTFTRVKK